MSSSKISTSIVWKTLERGGFYGIKMLIQILLARILVPEEFGVVSIILVFVDLLTIFVQSGFNTALIQEKDATEEDFSSVFWLSLGIAGVLYALLIVAAPWIAAFYGIPSLILYLRVFGVMLFGGAINSIQIAHASRYFNFRVQFICNSAAVIVSGVVSIAMAYMGAGAWALIVQQLVWQYLNCILMFIFEKWKPSLVFNWSRIRKLMSFGWKMLASSILMRMNIIASNLIIGKRFSSESLAYFTKAQSFTVAFSDVVITSYSSVMLSSASEVQEQREEVKNRIHYFIQSNMFLSAPLLVGLACVAKPFVQVLLTDKWLSCVPLMQLFCVMYLFQPICAIYGQAINGIGHSDLYFRTLAIAKPIGIVLLIIIAAFTEDAKYIAASMIVTAMIEAVIQAFIVKRLFGHGLMQQFADWIKPIAAALIMAVPVYLLNNAGLPPFITMVVQICVGALVYAPVILTMRHPSAIQLFNKIKTIFSRK